MCNRGSFFFHLESTIPSNTVRLVDSSLPHTGRVEVYYNGFWTSVCDTNWHYKESNVVCRQLGFVGADNSYHKTSVGPRIPYPILGTLQCDGTEVQWTDCLAYDWNVMNCGSIGHAVGVNCIPNEREGDIRLVGTTSENVGRVEIYHQGQWGTICDDGWNINDAEVVCRQLGFPGAVSALDNASFGQVNWVILLDDVSCIGTEHHLLDCRHSGWYRHNCEPGDEAGVRCNMPDVHYPRLANGSKPCEGRVEIWNGDQWTKLCLHANLHENVADTVCKELGFDEVDFFEFDDRFGQGYGPPSDNDYWCFEEKDSLSQCTIHLHYDSACTSVVLGCKKRDSPLSTIIPVWGISFGAVISLICFICISKRCKLHQSCKRTDSRADPNGQINERPSVISTNVNEDAPPAYNDVVDSHV
ncbi:Scavenger receptor cysteine-rich domain superfamily protein [Holothuria leucospilota]|uniref:Scavenger receptor cysteine-rich domain superfamily protein n=1 Tax=Holothuria leucospilota TaxID=206669 RepID=A0A9Q0YPY1_HOLLE|nr:Scavenger receptor cysteine-rich domain superfamily protein [Holothuria leucospilota]